MFYMLKRTWPSLLKTAMICGTACYLIAASFMSSAPDPTKSTEDPIALQKLELELQDLRLAMRRHELAIITIVEQNPNASRAVAEMLGRPVIGKVANGRVLFFGQSRQSIDPPKN